MTDRLKKIDELDSELFRLNKDFIKTLDKLLPRGLKIIFQQSYERGDAEGEILNHNFDRCGLYQETIVKCGNQGHRIQYKDIKKII